MVCLEKLTDIDLIHYDDKPPLTSELEYFAKCVNYGNEIQISNGLQCFRCDTNTCGS